MIPLPTSCDCQLNNLCIVLYFRVPCVVCSSRSKRKPVIPARHGMQPQLRDTLTTPTYHTLRPSPFVSANGTTLFYIPCNLIFDSLCNFRAQFHLANAPLFGKSEMFLCLYKIIQSHKYVCVTTFKDESRFPTNNKTVKKALDES